MQRENVLERTASVVRCVLVVAELDASEVAALEAVMDDAELTACVCGSLASARDLMVERRPSVVVMALRLPDGPWTALWDGGPPTMPCVLLAQSDGLREAIAALDHGVLDYLLHDVAVFSDWPRVVLRAQLEWASRRARIDDAVGLWGDTEASFRAVVENASLGLCAVATDGTLLAVNQKMADIFGYTQSELTGMSVNSIAHPDDHNVSPSFIESSLDGKVESAIFKKRYIHKQGHIITGRVTSRLARDRHGEPLFFVSTVEDLTEQERSEARLRESEARFRSAFETTGHGMAIVSADGRFIKINSTFCALVGYSMEEMLAISFQQITCPEDLAADLENVRRLLAGEADAYKMEKRYLHKGGHLIWVILSVSLVRDASGAPRHFVSQVIDITERKLTEQALLESEQQYRSLSESHPDDVVRFDRAYRHIYANTSVIDRIGGGEPSAVLMRSHREMGFPEALCDRIERSIDAVFETGESYVDVFDVELLEQTIEWRVFPEFGQDGVVSVLGVARDITEQRRIEMKLLESQKMDSIGNLAGGVAHDFNNMLTGIMGSASLLELMEQDGERRKLIQDILSASERAAELTQKLLAFGRRGMTRERAVHLNTLVREAAGILERTVDRSVRIDQELAPDLLWIDADPSQMVQVIMNICINAAEAMPRGGRVVIRTRNATAEQRRVVLEVEDTGSGMERDTLQRAFEPFFTTKHEGEIQGTGLGLAVVYGVIKRHGGDIEIESEPGKGTVIRVLMPPREGDGQSPSVSEASAERVEARGCVLLVDDEAVVRQSAQSMLEHLGFEVLIARDGVEGVERFQTDFDRVDLVLLDLRMPRLNGEDTFKALRAIDPEVTVVVSSGFGSDSQHEALLEMGVAALCPKPYTLTRLSEVLQEVLGA